MCGCVYMCVIVCMCVVAFGTLLWSVILLHSSCEGNLTAGMLIAAQGKTSERLHVCVHVFVSHWW